MRIGYVLQYLLIGSALVSCNPSEHHSSKFKYKEMAEKFKGKVAVRGLKDKENYIPWVTKEGKRVHIKKAWKNLKVQSCKACHEGHSLRDIKGKKYKRSHWNIKLKHSSEDVMNCTTCHNQSEVWSFNVGKKTVSANHTPKLCSQCHFKEERDWGIGAHGKRASGWQHSRAILNCVNCHNPHKPGFEKKWPKVAPYRPLNNEERL